MNIQTLTSYTLSPRTPLERGTVADGQGKPDTYTGAVAGDVVNLRTPPRLLDDDEVGDVFGQTLGMIAGNPLEALGVHGGLDSARVAALLA